MKTPKEIARETAALWDAHTFGPVEDVILKVAQEAIEADRAQRSYFLLSFEPDAIRDHFDVEEVDPTEDMSDEELESVAMEALQDDRLYSVFHELLSEGVGA